jgi:hypothetical protein
VRQSVLAKSLTVAGDFHVVEAAMIQASRNNSQANGGGDDDRSARKPFQFTLRTLFLLTLVVALFCSALATFDGELAILATGTIAWVPLAAVYWKKRVGRAVAFAHLCGPAYAAFVWALSASQGDFWDCAWKMTLGAGFTASAITSVGIACANRFQRHA